MGLKFFHTLIEAYAGLRRLAIHEFWIVALLTICHAVAAEAATRDISVSAAAISLAELTGGEEERGPLRFVAGLALTSGDSGFGGLSGLAMAPGGKTLTAINDRGEWLRMELERDLAGRPTGVAAASMTPILGVNGRPVAATNYTSDSEALARLANGDMLVAFERRNRVLRFPAGTDLSVARPRLFGFRAGSRRFVQAHGLEAMAGLAGGGVLIVEENRRGDAASFVGWRIGPKGGAPKTVRYTTLGAFKPTGLARLDGGDLLMLERRFSLLGGFASRVVRLAAKTLDGKAPLRGDDEIIRLQAPGLSDNFEAIDAVPRAGGGHDVYLLSDDNFNFLQRTLLLQFILEK